MADRPCETCGGETIKVIYFGLPGRLCLDEQCSTLTGLATFAPPVATETWDGTMFAFMPYEGSYWRALWRWVFAGSGEDHD